MEPELECQIQKVKEKQWGLRQAAQGNFQVSPLRQCRGLHIRFVILWCLAWGLAATGIIAATDVGIQRFAHSCDTGRSATKCRKRRFAFETTPTQQHQEMPAESGTQGTSAGEARIADADLSRRGQSTYSKRKAEAQGRCRDLAAELAEAKVALQAAKEGKDVPMNEMEELENMLCLDTEAVKENSALKSQIQVLELERKQHQQQMYNMQHQMEELMRHYAAHTSGTEGTAPTAPTMEGLAASIAGGHPTLVEDVDTGEFMGTPRRKSALVPFRAHRTGTKRPSPYGKDGDLGRMDG